MPKPTAKRKLDFEGDNSLRGNLTLRVTILFLAEQGLCLKDCDIVF